MKYLKFCLMMWVFTVLLIGNKVLADERPIVIVEIEGVGESVKDCKKDALFSAVKSTVGSFVNGETLVNDDIIVEKILEVSDAYVEKFKVVKKPKKDSDGLYHCTLKVWVRKKLLQKKVSKVKPMRQGTDTGSAVAEISSKIEDEKQGAEILRRYITDLEPKLLVCRIIDKDGEPVGNNSKPEVVQLDNGKYQATWRLAIYFDFNQYYNIVCPALDEVFTAIGDVVEPKYINNYTQATSSNIEAIRKYTNIVSYPQYAYMIRRNKVKSNKLSKKYDNIIWLSTGVDGKFRSERFKIYKISGKRYSDVFKEMCRQNSILKIKVIGADDRISHIKEEFCGINAYSSTNSWGGGGADYASRFCAYKCVDRSDVDRGSIIISPTFGRYGCWQFFEISSSSLNYSVVNLAYFFNFQMIFDSLEELENISHLEFEFSSKIISDLRAEPNKPNED